MKVIIKVILVILVLGCLLNLPYGYFQFVKIVCFIGFFILCLGEQKEGRTIISLLSGMAAILFNPFFKIPFTRGIWNKIDLYVAIILLIWIFYDLVFDPKSLKKLKW